jgi:glycosyltransferase involved in cell wall biosynthesis
MNLNSKVSVILPICNEVENIEPLVRDLNQMLFQSKHPFEIICVDDGSKDGTRDLLRSLAAEMDHLKVIFFRRNYGQTAAFDAGFRAATGEIILSMDSDRQYDVNDIPAMISMVAEQDYDFVSGWRKNRKDNVFVRTIPSKIANWIIRSVTKSKIHDLGCSLKVYRRELTDQLRIYGEMHRFINVLVEDMGGKVGEVEVRHFARPAGQSKYGLSRTFKVLLDLLTVWFLTRFRTKPLYVFGSVGSLMVTLAVVVAGVVLWQKFAFDVKVHRNPLFVISAISALLGVQFFGLGLLAELQARTYFEASDKLPYLVGESLNFDAKERLKLRIAGSKD